VVHSTVEAARTKVRHSREALISEALTNPLSLWLSEWPASGGTSYERLHQVLKRVPETIRSLDVTVNQKLTSEPQT